MTREFYGGHLYSWTDRFIKTTPPRRLTCISYVLAEILHHCYRTKNGNGSSFNLTHRDLQKVGLDRRCIRPYLEAFQKQGLISFEIKPGTSPKVTLLVVPEPYTHLKNPHNKKKER